MAALGSIRLAAPSLRQPDVSRAATRRHKRLPGPMVSSSLNGEPVVMPEVKPEGGCSMTTTTASTASTAHEPTNAARGAAGRDESTRRFSRGRITGLTLIAVLTLGLVYLHLAGSSTAVSVPAGAHAGQLTLKSCTYNTEKGAYAADCGTLVVPEDRADPHSRLIALPVIGIRAHSAHPGDPIFRLEGGPGVTNMKFADASRFTATHDVVLVGYRGVDGSVRLDCPEVSSAMDDSGDLLREQADRAVAPA